MMTMDRAPPERSDHWTSSCTTVGGFGLRDCVEIAHQESEVHMVVEDVNCSQTCRQNAAIAKRTDSIASSTADENTDCESREVMEARRQKREKANQNERKRSQGINDCLKQQEARLKQHTDLDTGKLGKKGIMQEFTKCFDQYSKYGKYTKDVLDLANALVQSGHTVQSVLPSVAAATSLQSGNRHTSAASMTINSPGYPMLVQSVPMTPMATPCYSANVNTATVTPEGQAQLQLQQQQQNLPPTFMTYGQSSLLCTTGPGYSTPMQSAPHMSMSYYGPTPCASVTAPLRQQPAPLYYLPIQTPNSQMAPAPAVALGGATPSPAAANFSRKRPSAESSASGGSSSPPVKMTCRAVGRTSSAGEAGEPPLTPCRPAADRNSFAGCGTSSDRLEVLSSVCALQRQNVLSENGGSSVCALQRQNVLSENGGCSGDSSSRSEHHINVDDDDEDIIAD